MSWLNKPLHLDKVASYTWQIPQINPSSFSPWTPSSWTYLPVQQSHTARWLVLLVFCLFSASHTLSLVRNLLASQLLFTYSIPMTDPRVIKEKTWHILSFPTGVKREQRPHKLSYNYWWNQLKKSLIPNICWSFDLNPIMDTRVSIQRIRSSNYFLWTDIRKCHA